MASERAGFVVEKIYSKMIEGSERAEERARRQGQGKAGRGRQMGRGERGQWTGDRRGRRGGQSVNGEE